MVASGGRTHRTAHLSSQQARFLAALVAAVGEDKIVVIAHCIVDAVTIGAIPDKWLKSRRFTRLGIGIEDVQFPIWNADNGNLEAVLDLIWEIFAGFLFIRRCPDDDIRNLLSLAYQDKYSRSKISQYIRQLVEGLPDDDFRAVFKYCFPK